MAQKFAEVSPELNEFPRQIVDAAFKVHKKLGPGLLESTYRIRMVRELTLRGLRVEQEISLPVEYEGIKLDGGYRIDLLVEQQIIVELKAVNDLLAIHRAQLLSYLKHSGKRLGLLINFNSVLIKDGMRRIINN